MPDQREIDRLRSWRELRRPLQCTKGKPCWVDDPYQTCPGSSRGGVCTSCNGRLTFNAAAFNAWKQEQSAEPT